MAPKTIAVSTPMAAQVVVIVTVTTATAIVTATTAATATATAAAAIAQALATRATMRLRQAQGPRDLQLHLVIRPGEATVQALKARYKWRVPGAARTENQKMKLQLQTSRAKTLRRFPWTTMMAISTMTRSRHIASANSLLTVR